MKNGKDWIDFNLIKGSVSMEMLIIHFGLFHIQREGDEVRLKCPFHNGKSDNSMTINLADDRFYCFGCKSGGGVIDFVARYEDCTVKDAAIKLNEWFQIERQIEEGREVAETASDASQTASQQLTPAHLIASIELQLAQLKRLLTSR